MAAVSNRMVSSGQRDGQERCTWGRAQDVRTCDAVCEWNMNGGGKLLLMLVTLFFVSEGVRVLRRTEEKTKIRFYMDVLYFVTRIKIYTKDHTNKSTLNYMLSKESNVF